MTFKTIIGSRAEVGHGTAKHPSGGLTKAHLMKNKSGRIVSRKKHFSAKRENRLVKAGYKTKKGHFGFIKNGKSMKKGRSRSRKMRGGDGEPVGMGYIDGPTDRALTAGGRSRSRKMRGGMALGGNLSPHAYDGQGVGTSGVGLQLQATNY